MSKTSVQQFNEQKETLINTKSLRELKKAAAFTDNNIHTNDFYTKSDRRIRPATANRISEKKVYNNWTVMNSKRDSKIQKTAEPSQYNDNSIETSPTKRSLLYRARNHQANRLCFSKDILSRQDILPKRILSREKILHHNHTSMQGSKTTVVESSRSRSKSNRMIPVAALFRPRSKRLRRC